MLFIKPRVMIGAFWFQTCSHNSVNQNVLKRFIVQKNSPKTLEKEDTFKKIYMCSWCYKANDNYK